MQRNLQYIFIFYRPWEQNPVSHRVNRIRVCFKFVGVRSNFYLPEANTVYLKVLKSTYTLKNVFFYICIGL